MAPGPIPDGAGIASAGAAAGVAVQSVTQIGTRTVAAVQTRLQDMTQAMDGALEGIGTALRNMGGQATIYAPEALAYLPEVGL